MKVGNVNVDRVAQEAEAVKADRSKGLRRNRLEIVWNTDVSKPQLQAAVKYEQGQVVMEADSPSFMGGEGRRPGPLHYCIMGFAACFTSSFATAAAAKKVNIKKLSVVAECELDFAKVYGVADDPIVRNVSFTVDLESDASHAMAEQLKEEALQRCPGVFVLQNKIPVSATLK